MPGDAFRCDCGSSEFAAIVQFGSYTLACKQCRRTNVATSFIAIAPQLTGYYRAALIDDDGRELSVLVEGQAQALIGAVRSAAGSGQRVRLEPQAR